MNVFNEQHEMFRGAVRGCARMGALGFPGVEYDETYGGAAAEQRPRGISLFLVELETPGFTVSRTLDTMGMRAPARQS